MSTRAQEIGQRIKAARQAKKLSQTELATQLHKTLRSVQKYESGEVEPSIALLNDIASVLKVSPAELIGYENPSVQFKCLSDVFSAINELNKKAGIRFEIQIRRPPEYREWSCALVFNGKDLSAPQNQDICLFLERFNDMRRDLDSYSIDQEYFDHWMETELAYYATSWLEDQSAETLSTEERLRRRNELLREGIEKMIEKDSGEE